MYIGTPLAKASVILLWPQCVRNQPVACVKLDIGIILSDSVDEQDDLVCTAVDTKT